MTNSNQTNNANNAGNQNVVPASSPGQIFGQAILQWLEGANFQKSAHRLHKSFWLIVIAFYVSQFFAGVFDYLYGHVAMLVLETIVILLLGALWTIPELLAAEVVISIAAATNSNTFESDTAIKNTLSTWFKWFLNTAAYTVGIVVTVLLLFDIKIDFASMAALLSIGIVLGVVTGAIGKTTNIALEIAQAGLIGCIVKILVEHIPEATKVDGMLVTARELIVSHSSIIAVATIVLMIFGFGWIKWVWNNLIILPLIKIGQAIHPKKVLGTFGAIVVLVIVGMIAYWFIDPQGMMQVVDEKVGEMRAATANTKHLPEAGEKLKNIIPSITPSEPVDVSYTIKGFEGRLCGLPNGKHTINAQQTELQVIIQNDPTRNGAVDTIPSILGGLSGPPVEELIYKKVDYYWGILFNERPSGETVSIKNGCIQVVLNVPKTKRMYYDIQEKNILITVQ